MAGSSVAYIISAYAMASVRNFRTCERRFTTDYVIAITNHDLDTLFATITPFGVCSRVFTSRRDAISGFGMFRWHFKRVFGLKNGENGRASVQFLNLF